MSQHLPNMSLHRAGANDSRPPRAISFQASTTEKRYESTFRTGGAQASANSVPKFSWSDALREAARILFLILIPQQPLSKFPSSLDPTRPSISYRPTSGHNCRSYQSADTLLKTAIIVES